MRKEVRFAGFGGQGVVKSAIILSIAAGLFEGMEIAQTQSYGPEARGGACRAEVVISDQEIGFIKPIHIDCFVVMSQAALDKYVESIDPERTVVIADTTLIERSPPEIKQFHGIQATRIAEEEFGKALYANIIMLGAFSPVTGIVSITALEKTLAGNVPPTTLATNLIALRRGDELGRKMRTSRA